MINPALRNGPVFRGLKIGLFGGTFDPPHAWHLHVSLYALKRLGLHQVWWLVTPGNPLKKHRDDVASLEDRGAACRALTRGHPRLVVTAIEKELGTHATVETLRALKGRMPGARFVWMMGADNLAVFPRWQGWDSIPAMVPIAVFRRPGYAVGRGLGKAAIRFGRAWRPSSACRVLTYGRPPVWTVLENRLNALSSTNIRRDIFAENPYPKAS